MAVSQALRAVQADCRHGPMNVERIYLWVSGLLHSHTGLCVGSGACWKAVVPEAGVGQRWLSSSPVGSQGGSTSGQV